MHGGQVLVDSLIGTTIGGYALIRVLGNGGMGTVYLAEDPAIGQQVAIKVVRTDADSLTDIGELALATERFRREARAVASLDHSHILPLYRYGEEKTSSGQRAYMIMQYRPEGSLWDWVRRRAEAASAERGDGPALAPTVQVGMASSPLLPDGVWPLPLAEANEYLRQAASALQYAHDRGIIHRDVKPANFLLRVESGQPVHLLLSDFGLAKMFTSNSATTTILGTPLYMAPEQFEGAAMPESDQYALAVMIYYLLAGRPPFEGEPIYLMNQHLTAPVPPITAFNPALPGGVQDVLGRALAKRPLDRYARVADFADAFAQVVQEHSEGIFGLRPYLSLPTLTQGGAASPYAPTVASPAAPAPQVTPSPIPQLSHQTPQLTPERAMVSPHVPLTFAATQSPQAALHRTPSDAQALTAQASNPLTPSTPSAPVGPVAPVAPVAPVQPPSPGKPGMSRRSALGWILAGAATAAALGGAGFFFYTKFHTPAHSLSVLQGHSGAVTGVSWSPDGSKLVSGSRDKTAKIWQVANGQAVATYSGHTGALLSVAWHPTRQLLASGGEDDTVQVWDTAATRRRNYRLGKAVSSVCWSMDGNYIVAGTLGNGAHVLPLAAGSKPTGTLSRLNIHALAFSPDGRYIAAAISNVVVVITVQEPHKIVFRRGQQGQQGQQGQAATALSVAWSLDDTRLAAGYANNIAEVYNFSPGTSAHGTLLNSFPHNGAVNGVAWEPTVSPAARLATVCSDGTLNFWNIASNTNTAYNGYGPAMLAVAWSSSGLVTGDANNTVILWQVP
jgi:serine/threonine protein kinase/WD40 repeat protein